MARTKKSPFSPALFQFLGELALHNERDWFNANKSRYESDVREPALEFIRLMAPHLTKVSPHFEASDKKVGGSLMRVHRDTRFSKDKTPYKTNVGIQFRHEGGKDVHAPGFYLHIEDDEVFVGCGMWRPESGALAAVRAHIDENQAAWKKVLRAKRFHENFNLGGESLKRPPRGYDADHPLIDDLKRKDHIASCSLKPKLVTSGDFVKQVADRFAATKPYVEFLCAALDVPF